MKKIQNPEVKLICLANSDVLTTSVGNAMGRNTETTWGSTSVASRSYFDDEEEYDY